MYGVMEIKRGSDLERQVWTFVFIPDSTPKLLLRQYREESRANKRRKKWVESAFYSHTYTGIMSDYEDVRVLKRDEVPFPEDVVVEAKKTFMDHLVVTKEIR